MNKVRALLAPALLAAGLLALAACGGGMQTADSGGTGGTGMTAHGVVASASATGVVVNSVNFATANATISAPPGAGVLRPGMIVTVHGQVDAAGLNGTASSISYSGTVIGRTAGDTTGTGFAVYGQTVTYHLPVTFEDLDGNLTTKAAAGDPVPAWLATSAAVEVSGFTRSNGVVEATYVRALDWPNAETGADTELEFLGLVTGQGSGSITVNGMRVLTSTSIPVGSYVHVHALAPASPDEAGITATEIEIIANEVSGSDGDDGKLEGVVANLAADRASFTLDGQLVTIIPGTTTYKDEYGNRTELDLANDVHVEVHGRYAGGQFVADEIEFE